MSITTKDELNSWLQNIDKPISKKTCKISIDGTPTVAKKSDSFTLNNPSKPVINDKGEYYIDRISINLPLEVYELENIVSASYLKFDEYCKNNNITVVYEKTFKLPGDLNEYVLCSPFLPSPYEIRFYANFDSGQSITESVKRHLCKDGKRVNNNSLHYMQDTEVEKEFDSHLLHLQLHQELHTEVVKTNCGLANIINKKWWEFWR